MGWPDKSTKQTEPHDGLIGAFLYWLGGFGIEDGLTAGLSEREQRRIRAKQIDAVTRLIPVAMAVTMLNVAIVLILFWGRGWNDFLAIWGLTLAVTASLAVRAWRRSHQSPPQEASSPRNAADDATGVLPRRDLGRAAARAVQPRGADQPADPGLPDGRDDVGRCLHALDLPARRPRLSRDHDRRLRRRDAVVRCVVRMP